ncbi:MAG TPA: hypothetical protein VMS17_19610, partial [Gemmataceae bacterium]|nr:hypothetical protein [Gemmataceae bacterium]
RLGRSRWEVDISDGFERQRLGLAFRREAQPTGVVQREDARRGMTVSVHGFLGGGRRSGDHIQNGCNGRSEDRGLV